MCSDDQWSFFQNQITFILDTLIGQMNDFRGDLSDITAKTATLVATLHSCGVYEWLECL